MCGPFLSCAGRRRRGHSARRESRPCAHHPRRVGCERRKRAHVSGQASADESGRVSGTQLDTGSGARVRARACLSLRVPAGDDVGAHARRSRGCPGSGLLRRFGSAGGDRADGGASVARQPRAKTGRSAHGPYARRALRRRAAACGDRPFIRLTPLRGPATVASTHTDRDHVQAPAVAHRHARLAATALRTAGMRIADDHTRRRRHLPAAGTLSADEEPPGGWAVPVLAPQPRGLLLQHLGLQGPVWPARDSGPTF